QWCPRFARSRKGFDLAADRYLRRQLVVDDHEGERVLPAGTLPPLPAGERRLGDVGNRSLRPVEVADDRRRGQRLQRVADLGLLGAAGLRQRRHRYLEQGVDEAERLGPLLAGRLVRVGELLRGLPGERALVRRGRVPPHLGAEVLADRAERLDRRREQQRLADRRDLRGVALLLGLLPERREVGRDRHAEQDLGVLRLEPGDLRGEVLGAVRVVPRVGDRVTALADDGREPGGRVAPGVAV